MDRRTYKHGEANSDFSQLCKRTQKAVYYVSGANLKYWNSQVYGHKILVFFVNVQLSMVFPNVLTET